MANRKKSVEQVITSTAFQRDFRAIAQKLHAGESRYVVKISGLPVMAVLPISEYEELMQKHAEYEREEQEREQQVKTFEHLARKFGEAVTKSGMTEDHMMAELEKDKAAVYEDTYGDASKKKKV